MVTLPRHVYTPPRPVLSLQPRTRSRTPPALSKMHWTLLLLSLPTLALASFENTAIVRTVELGGALVHITTTYAVRALAPDAGTYTFSLSEEDAQRTSFVEARVKGQKAPLALEKYGFNPRTCVPPSFLTFAES